MRHACSLNLDARRGRNRASVEGGFSQYDRVSGEPAQSWLGTMSLTAVVRILGILTVP